jgi:hypothetical protein
MTAGALDFAYRVDVPPAQRWRHRTIIIIGERRECDGVRPRRARQPPLLPGTST